MLSYLYHVYLDVILSSPNAFQLGSSVVKVLSSGTIGHGNQNLVTGFMVRLRFSLYCHKSAQIKNVVRHLKSRMVISRLHFK